jgi:hypothetical protein
MPASVGGGSPNFPQIQLQQSCRFSIDAHRWWGGTELTNEHLWRWDTTNGALIAP